MKTAFIQGFLGELEKYAVSQKWVRKKLKDKGPGKLEVYPRTKYFLGRVLPRVEGGMEEMVRRRKKRGKPVHNEAKPDQWGRRGARLGEREGRREAAEGLTAHHETTGKRTVIGGRGSKGPLPTGDKPRETFHHEAWHRKSPILSRSETAAHTYGAIKARVPGKLTKLKHVLKSAKQGAKRDLGLLKQKFVAPVGRALVGTTEK